MFAPSNERSKAVAHNWEEKHFHRPPKALLSYLSPYKVDHISRLSSMWFWTMRRCHDATCHFLLLFACFFLGGFFLPKRWLQTFFFCICSVSSVLDLFGGRTEVCMRARQSHDRELLRGKLEAGSGRESVSSGMNTTVKVGSFFKYRAPLCSWCPTSLCQPFSSLLICGIKL